MWKYFFEFDGIPSEYWVTQFGPVHIAWVLSAFVLIFLIAYMYKKQSVEVRRRIELVFAVVMICGYAFRWIWVIALGKFVANEMLPLHLCAISSGIIVAAIFTGKPLLKEFGYACGLPGGVVTFLMPGEPYPLFHFFYLLYILSHLMLILMPIIWIWGDGFRPDLKRLFKCFLILLGITGAIIIINSLLGSNFMFISYAPDNTPLKAAADWAGNPGYQFFMALILFGVWLILYTPWVLLKRKAAKMKVK